MSGASTNEVRERAARVAASGDDLRAMDRERVVRSLARACASLADTTTAEGEQARRLLAESSGLSEAMVDWALREQVALASEETLGTLAMRYTGPRSSTVPSRARLAVTVLSGNVFTAAVRAVLLPLLAKVPIVLKASSRDDVFPRLLVAAVRFADEELGRSVEVLTFPGGETDLEDSLFSQADVVSVYGSDSTLAEIRGRLPATTTFVAHGHGIGAVWVPAAAMRDHTSAVRVADAIALDVAAYDQRGCLSPHAVWVEPSASVTGKQLAELLAEHSLERLSRELPRGPLPRPAGAAQVQWRGVAAARGELFERDGWAVSWESDGPLRLSPGWRNVSVLECPDERELGRRLLPLGMHLKALGVAGDQGARTGIARHLPPALAPRISDVGRMQTPPLDSLADGVSPWTGLVRWTQVD